MWHTRWNALSCCALLLSSSTTAWVTRTQPPRPLAPRQAAAAVSPTSSLSSLALTSSPSSESEPEPRWTSRRAWIQTSFAAAVVAATSSSCPAPSMAAALSAQDEKDLANLAKGYERLTYLLDNWVSETTVCGKSDDNPYTGNKGCERTPLIVMDYMGYKSTSDPLFKADKTLKRLAARVPAEDTPEYLDALEQWAESAEEASGMAYISSWGEANPGGGKDRVELFIERAKQNVLDARQSLKTALALLGKEV